MSSSHKCSQDAAFRLTNTTGKQQQQQLHEQTSLISKARKQPRGRHTNEQQTCQTNRQKTAQRLTRRTAETMKQHFNAIRVTASCSLISPSPPSPWVSSPNNLNDLRLTTKAHRQAGTQGINKPSRFYRASRFYSTQPTGTRDESPNTGRLPCGCG